MGAHLRSSDAMRARHEQLERYVQQEGREWMRWMMQGHLELRAELERPVEVRCADGVRRGYRRENTRRPLRMVFGDVYTLRVACEARGAEALHRTDAALNLPEELYSYGVRRRLREGLPIATGVIEGACRYLVRDRMAVSGSWSRADAEAVVRLRALSTNDDFDAYWGFHLQREYERTDRSRYPDGRVPVPVGPPKAALRRVK